MTSDIRRVGIVFSGGPAPGANAVIAAAATPFIDAGIDVLGIFHGYSHLAAFTPSSPLMPNVHYRKLERDDVLSLRNQPGVLIGTARINPGMGVNTVQDLSDPVRCKMLKATYDALRSLNIDALISIGGDGTLMTANYLHRYQVENDLNPHVKVVHLPKTIDNDYHGIDFTFGFFTAVDGVAKQLLNLRADARATSAYFIVQVMGRQAAWLAYGAATAGEADLVLGAEDAPAFYGDNNKVDLARVVDRINKVVTTRERQGRHYGVIVVAEGFADHLDVAQLPSTVERDHLGNLKYGQIPLAQIFARAASDAYSSEMSRKKSFKPAKLGYESRSAAPLAFDVLLGSQLGVGAYRALVEEGLDAHMVSVHGQLALRYLPFDTLVDAETFRTEVRFVPPKSDFRRLVRLLETQADSQQPWDLGRRLEPS